MRWLLPPFIQLFSFKFKTNISNILILKYLPYSTNLNFLQRHYFYLLALALENVTWYFSNLNLAKSINEILFYCFESFAERYLTNKNPGSYVNQDISFATWAILCQYLRKFFTRQLMFICSFALKYFCCCFRFFCFIIFFIFLFLSFLFSSLYLLIYQYF